MWHATARRRAARTTHTDTRCTIRIQNQIRFTHSKIHRLRGVGRTDTVVCNRHFTRRTVVCAARPSGAVGAVYIHAHNNHKRPRTRARHQYSHIIQRFGQRSRMHVYTTGICAPLRLSTRTYSIPSAQPAAVLLRWQGLLVRSACSPRPSAKSARRATWAGERLPTRVSTRAG